MMINNKANWKNIFAVVVQKKIFIQIFNKACDIFMLAFFHFVFV